MSLISMTEFRTRERSLLSYDRAVTYPIRFFFLALYEVTVFDISICVSVDARSFFFIKQQERQGCVSEIVDLKCMCTFFSL